MISSTGLACGFASSRIGAAKTSDSERGRDDRQRQPMSIRALEAGEHVVCETRITGVV
jgi:hypothetical protein